MSRRPARFDVVPVYPVSVPQSPLRFAIREETLDTWFVVTFGTSRLQYCRSLALAERAVRLWDRILRKRNQGRDRRRQKRGQLGPVFEFG